MSARYGVAPTAAGEVHPGFRRLCRVLNVLVQVLVLAREMGMLKMGKISVDDSKFKANASKHGALSWGHIKKIKQQLRQEIQQLMALAESEDRKKIPDRMDVPEQIARRKTRLAALDEAKRKFEERARA